MAKKRKRRSRKNKTRSKDSIKSWIRKGINTVAGPVAFWNQLSEKDYQVLNATPEYRALDYMGKAKVAVNIITGSMTGRVLFSDQYNPSPNGNPRINPAGVINKWTPVWLIGKIYGKVGKSMKLPEYASINKISNKILFGSVIGGFFDPPSAQGRISTYAVSPSVTTQNRATTTRSIAQFNRNLSYDPSTMGALR
jgi:hypothetical protein